MYRLPRAPLTLTATHPCNIRPDSHSHSNHGYPLLYHFFTATLILNATHSFIVCPDPTHTQLEATHTRIIQCTTRAKATHPCIIFKIHTHTQTMYTHICIICPEPHRYSILRLQIHLSLVQCLIHTQTKATYQYIIYSDRN